MPIAIEPICSPLAVDDHGTIRIGGTRVTLDSVIAAFREGYSAEEISEQYPSLSLADVYGTIAYYLRRREPLDLYLREGLARQDEAYAEIDVRHPPGSIRERLLGRSQGKRCSASSPTRT
ncbi:MAG: DUF433 domain-containing protein [Planctomycetes bacterium]|nr:DUF433 domain-containing protein [Planctomycetota bacterium]